jgi:hypothetical protein
MEIVNRSGSEIAKRHLHGCCSCPGINKGRNGDTINGKRKSILVVEVREPGFAFGCPAGSHV